MKRFIILPFFSFFIASICIAQAPSLGLAKVGIAVGGDIEMPHGLSHNYLLSTAKASDFTFDQEKFSKGEVQGMQCDNSATQYTVVLSPPASQKMELRLSLFSLEDRIDQVDYMSTTNDDFMSVKATSSELGVEGVYLRKDRLAKWFSIYGGGGMNLGYSYGGEVEVTQRQLQPLDPDKETPPSDIYDGYQIMQETVNVFDQKDGMSQRLFLEGGFGIHFLKRMEISLLFRKGLGYRATFDGPFNFTTLKSSALMGFTYNFF